MVSWLTCLGLKSGRLIQQTEKEEGAVWLSLPPCLGPEGCVQLV